MSRQLLDQVLTGVEINKLIDDRLNNVDLSYQYGKGDDKVRLEAYCEIKLQIAELKIHLIDLLVRKVDEKITNWESENI